MRLSDQQRGRHYPFGAAPAAVDQKPCWMRSKMTLVKAEIWLPMNGPVSATTSMMATILGTKVSVISWIWVSAWMSAIPMPTTIATSTTGAEAVSTVHTAYWTISRASASFMGRPLRTRLGGRLDGDACADGDFRAIL